jgi:hypothetical protein
MRPTCVLHLVRVLDTNRSLSLTQRSFSLIQKEYIVRLAPRLLKYRCVTECVPDTIAWYVNYETNEDDDNEDSDHGDNDLSF